MYRARLSSAVGLIVTDGDDEVMAAWDGALLLALCTAGVIGAASLVRRVFITGVLADFSEPSSEALLCSLADDELTRLLVSVPISD
jgi:hypothetical protein